MSNRDTLDPEPDPVDDFMHQSYHAMETQRGVDVKLKIAFVPMYLPLNIRVHLMEHYYIELCNMES